MKVVSLNLSLTCISLLAEEISFLPGTGIAPDLGW